MDKGIMVKLDLNSTGFNNGVKSAVTSTDKLKSALGSADTAVEKHGNIASKVGAGLKATAKVAATAMAAVGAATVAMVSSAVKSYADYEQLVGGVDTLFKDSSAAVQANAQKAFSTAGLSANAYMETVTSFSASLLQSLKGDTVKAASYADSAIVDMSDNANKMGSSMESIQTAYQGFAKQNYTMLDNLKLGYGGTKEEMQRLLNDAQKISGVKYDLSSFADITQAIHVIQTEMDITGTTAKEASSTISGSFNAMKAAWSNTMVALVTGGEFFDNSIDALKDTVLTFVQNIMPAIEGALRGAASLIGELIPIIIEELPKILGSIVSWIGENAPQIGSAIINAVGNAINGIGDMLGIDVSGFGAALTNIFGSIKDALASVMKAIGPVIPSLVAAIGEALVVVADVVSELLAAVGPIVEALMPIAGVVIDVFRQLLPAVAPVLKTLAQGIAQIAKVVAPVITLLVELLKPAIDVVVSVVQAALTVLQPILEGSFNHIQLVIQLVTSLLRGDFAGAWESIKGIVSNTFNTIINIVQSVIGAIGAHLQACIGIFSGVFNAVWQTVSGIFENIKNTIREKITAAVNTVREVFGRIKQIVSDVWNGIKGIIKVPHIEVVGNLSIAGLDTPIPKLGLKWYAAGGIMDRPTVFAGTGNTAHIGGEAGPEAILPLKPFWDRLERYMTTGKNGGGGNHIEQHFEVNINGTDRTPDEMADMVINNIIPRVKLAMSNI